MTSAMAAFGIAVAATSVICYALLTRAEKIRRGRGPAGDNSNDGGTYSGSDGWAAANWFGSDHSIRPISAAGMAEAAMGRRRRWRRRLMRSGVPEKTGILI